MYELRRTELLRDLFLWAYGRSATRADAPPIRAGMDRIVGQGSPVSNWPWAVRYIEDAERGRFREIAERELLSLHDGNFARYRITRSEFAAWQDWRG